MNGTRCPKCGSDQVLNDQCMKCGIVVSKYRAAPQGAGASPVSFVATPAANELPLPGYSIPAAVIEGQRARKRSKQITRLIGITIVTTVLVSGFLLYRFFAHRASHFGGLYKNQHMLFVLKFPEKESSQWYHYRSEPNSPLYKDVKDAFFRGTDMDNPELIIGVWSEPISALPDRFDPNFASKKLSETEDALLAIMVERGIDCTITDSKLTHPGENAGFEIAADISVNGKPMKLIAVRAHHVNNGFWFFFSGSEENMNTYMDEVEGLASSISFRLSVI